MPYRDPYVDPVPALKRHAARELARELADWDPSTAAARLGCDHWRIADLRAERTERFSLMTLVRHLARLRYSVSLSIEPPAR